MLGHRRCTFLPLLKNVTLFSKWSYQFSCPPVLYESFCYLRSLTTFFFFVLGFNFFSNNASNILQSSFSGDDFPSHFSEKIEQSEWTCHNSHHTSTYLHAFMPLYSAFSPIIMEKWSVLLAMATIPLVP